jgi:hypothetical protein
MCRLCELFHGIKKSIPEDARHEFRKLNNKPGQWRHTECHWCVWCEQPFPDQDQRMWWSLAKSMCPKSPGAKALRQRQKSVDQEHRRLQRERRKAKKQLIAHPSSPSSSSESYTAYGCHVLEKQIGKATWRCGGCHQALTKTAKFADQTVEEWVSETLGPCRLATAPVPSAQEIDDDADVHDQRRRERQPSKVVNLSVHRAARFFR